MRRWLGWPALSAVICVAAAAMWSAPALGQSRNDAAALDRFERQLERQQRESRILIDPTVQPTDRVLIDYGALLTPSFYSIDDPDGHNHVLRQYELVGYGRINIDGAHELFLRVDTHYDDFNDGDSFDGKGDDFVEPRLTRAHYKFDLARHLAAYDGKVINDDVTVQVGRQLVYWGNGLTLDEVIDGGVVRLLHGNTTLDLLAGVTYDKIVDFDISRPDFRNHTDRAMYGGILRTQAGNHAPYGYVLIQRDWNDDDPLVAQNVTTRFDYDSYYLGIGSSGSLTDRLLYAAEFVYEGGHGESNSFDENGAQVTQTEEDISAWALDGRLDYTYTNPQHTRLGAELILASGDKDRLASNSTFGGNQPGSQDHAFNAFGLVNTGLAFSPAVSNLAMLRMGGSTFPMPGSSRFNQLQVGADVLVFCKLLGEAPIDEPTNNDRFLGVEGDLYLTWQVTSDVTFALRYGGFIPGNAIEGDKSLRNLFYAGVTYAF
jgi:hypothetical protein